MRTSDRYGPDAARLYTAYRAAFRSKTIAGTLPRWKYVRPSAKRVWIEMARLLDNPGVA